MKRIWTTVRVGGKQCGRLIAIKSATKLTERVKYDHCLAGNIAIDVENAEKTAVETDRKTANNICCIQLQQSANSIELPA